MRSEKLSISLGCGLLLFGMVLGHTPQETNAVVSTMLLHADQYYLLLSHGNWDDLRDWFYTPETWEGFIHMGRSDGWLPEEKAQAFDTYVETASNMDLTQLSDRKKRLLASAVGFCSMYCRTNSYQALKRLATCSSGKFREEAISAAIKCAPVDASLVEFVSSVATNSVASTPWERVLALIGLKERLATNTVDAATLDSATRTFYRCREDGYSSVCCDSVLTNRIDGYALSSNRLQVACHMLSLTNMKARFTAYHVNVTNQLLSSGQPLRWVTIGGEGDE